MDTRIDALKIEISGAVTSFRYPHFTQGYQPTYDMPPPSTIYGHICNAVGRYLTDDERAKLHFGYVFKHSGKFVDYMEHLHFSDPIQPFPFNREMLFQPRLTLYLTGLDLEDAFRSPHYMVVLGRSQDLMTYHSVQKVVLQQVESAYLEHTLLPMWMAARLPKNVTVATMARYIAPNRQPEWESYALLQDIAPAWPPEAPTVDDEWDDLDDETDAGWQFEGDDVVLWAEINGSTHPKTGLPRAVWLHSFVK